MKTMFEIPGIGQVSMEDTLICYDEPFLYTIRSNKNERFLVFQSEITATHDIHWYSRIADEEYQKYLDGEIEMRAPFVERDEILETYWDYILGVYTQSRWLKPEELNTKMLPIPGARLKMEKLTREKHD